MKKFLALALIALLALSLLTACGRTTTDNPPPNNNNGTKAPSNGGDDPSPNNGGDEQVNLPSGWDQNPYGAWISGVWDDAYLPGCVPKIDVVGVDQTTYKARSHDTTSSSYGIGSIRFTDKNYERWGVVFTATAAQLDGFAAAMAQNGFYGGITDESVNGTAEEHEWVGNGYYACLGAQPSFMSDEYDFSVSFVMTNTQPKRPTAFKGTKLPDFGWVTEEYAEVGWGYDGENTVDGFYNVITDTGSLPDDWSFWLHYFGVTEAEAKAYAQTMAAAGWTIVHEGDYYEGTGYSCQLEKDGIVAGVKFNAGEGKFTGSVGFATVSESLWY